MILKRGDEAFVLLEVLLAAAVLAAGAAIYYQAMSSAVRAAGLAERRYRAALLLGKMVGETELLGQPASTTDKVDPDLGPLEWNIEGKTDPATGIKTWQIRLGWKNAGQTEDLTLEAIP